MSNTNPAEMWVPVFPLRDTILFPHMTLNFDIGRPGSVSAAHIALTEGRPVLLVLQKDENQEDPGPEDLYSIGCLANIEHILNLPGGIVRVMVEGICRGQVQQWRQTGDALEALTVSVQTEAPQSPELEAMVSTAKNELTRFANTSSRVAQETVDSILAIEDPDELADVIAANTLNKLKDRQSILETIPPFERLEKLSVLLESAIEIAELETKLQYKIHEAVEKNQKDYYLREQIRIYQKELGDTEFSDAEELRKKLAETPLNDEAREKCAKEIDRLSHMAPGTPEITTSLSYIEWLLEMPWGKYTQDNLDLGRARQILSENHYGLEKVKERIIEYLAVLQVKKDMKGPILCFVGPPGVGKTSVVRAIAKAIDRKFIQMALGGVRDEAEIRGHRRTYVGSIPGRIISGIRHAGVMNPVFLFDEIDKMSSDMRGDPASALLEVLDGEQNSSFRDHYMEIPFDLSKVLFVTTANSAETIPAPLFDRMEIIEVPSYTEEEKLHIASLHLFPRQLAEHGLQPGSISMDDSVLRSIIEGYTREAGVRTLERSIAKVIRKGVVQMLDTKASNITVTRDDLHEYLGAARYTREMPEKKPLVGTVVGLAYTEVGGETLEVECTIMPGKGGMKSTGKLGDVMKESAEAAYSWVRSRSQQLGLKPDFYSSYDVHIHIPEGAIPKDGPSAGVTLITSLVSAFTGIPVRQDVAMTGEITLRGRVLPIGGLKEKTLAAYRAGIRVLVIPRENLKDLEEIPAYVLSQFRVIAADTVEDVLREALLHMPEGMEPHA